MRRWPLYVAIAYVVLLYSSLFVVPMPPDATDTGARVVRFYQDHGNGVRVVTWLTALSAVPLALLVANLRSRITGLGRDVLLLGAAGLLVSTIVWSWIGAGLALHAETLDPHVARTIADISLYFGPVLTISIVLLVVPVGAAAWRGEGGFPRWLAWLTAVFAVEQTVETITVLGKRGFIAPGGPMNFAVGATMFAVWIIVAGATASDPAL